MRAFLLLPLISLLAAPAAAQQGRPYESAGGGFRVELPAEWVQVPDEALDVVRAQPGASETGIVYEVGFEAGGAAWPAPPVAAIAWMPLGQTLTVEEFRGQFAGPGAREDLQAGIDETPASQLGARVSAPGWDAENEIGWARMDLESDGATPAFAWTAARLHPDGRSAIMVVYYGALHQVEAPVRAQMLAVLQSLRAP
jgi:hypothetical protein